MMTSNYDSVPQKDAGAVISLEGSTPSAAAIARGEKQQPDSFRDGFFAILFIVQLIISVVYSNIARTKLQGIDFSQFQDDDVDIEAPDIDTGDIMKTVVVCCTLTSLMTVFFLRLSLSYARHLVSGGLIFSCVMWFAFFFIMLCTGQLFQTVLGAAFFALNVWYARRVWSRIPFAASNLVTAAEAVKSNSGLFLVAFSSIVIGFIWTICWGCSFAYFISIYKISCGDQTDECEDDGMNGMSSIVLFLLILSFYWTHQVLSNTIHVTVAGTVGSWWFDPISANSCCSSAVRDSYFRSSTYSFGSICFGSLLTAILRTLRAMAENSEENGIVRCLVQCILNLLSNILEYFNKWAYIYVGLYGYSYLEAGKNVIQLFTSRGWTTIITDDLVRSALILICLAIGVLTGVIGALVNTYFYTFGGDIEIGVIFSIGFIFGAFGSSIAFNTVESAVNTVIVCYADAPAEFQSNHPELSNEMRATWLQVYPNEFS